MTSKYNKVVTLFKIDLSHLAKQPIFLETYTSKKHLLSPYKSLILNILYKNITKRIHNITLHYELISIKTQIIFFLHIQ